MIAKHILCAAAIVITGCDTKLQPTHEPELEPWAADYSIQIAGCSVDDIVCKKTGHVSDGWEEVVCYYWMMNDKSVEPITEQEQDIVDEIN